MLVWLECLQDKMRKTHEFLAVTIRKTFLNTVLICNYTYLMQNRIQIGLAGFDKNRLTQTKYIICILSKNGITIGSLIFLDK